ncbi:quinone oxidoreductase family protein [Actinokineospora bangkokensis]|uniref:Enoyl reductase (ER) domain-containing protein n=1 Tax=Actinokineospora bangkokensis TaxID=1193682 RepID=A0A1Q9LK34_9PSEU|nr:zinc-binding dehydrogenase [Actinokineospora bangkokensis]OLR92363.1 hypothetical protein BJP25_19930 [Actinokineospora bangkokensis]
MKAAVLRAYGVPGFEEFPDPEPREGAQVVAVRAATVNAVDVAIAAGTHYLSPRELPVVPGIEGVGVLPDGQRVYFGWPVAPHGSMAPVALVRDELSTPLPDEVPDAVAATLGNAGLAAMMPMSWRAGLRAGESVLVLGATGVVGRLAVQVAKLLGAGRVVAAGRDPEALEELAGVGADAVVRLTEDDLTTRFTEAAQGRVDVVVDYTWGAPAEAALRAIATNGRLAQVGDRAGGTITVPSQVMRSTGAAVFGFMPTHAGPRVMAESYRRLLGWGAAGELDVRVEELPLSEVAAAWERERTSRHKLVLVP